MNKLEPGGIIVEKRIGKKPDANESMLITPTDLRAALREALIKLDGNSEAVNSAAVEAILNTIKRRSEALVKGGKELLSGEKAKEALAAIGVNINDVMNRSLAFHRALGLPEAYKETGLTTDCDEYNGLFDRLTVDPDNLRYVSFLQKHGVGSDAVLVPPIGGRFDLLQLKNLIARCIPLKVTETLSMTNNFWDARLLEPNNMEDLRLLLNDGSNYETIRSKFKKQYNKYVPLKLQPRIVLVPGSATPNGYQKQQSHANHQRTWNLDGFTKEYPTALEDVQDWARGRIIIDPATHWLWLLQRIFTGMPDGLVINELEKKIANGSIDNETLKAWIPGLDQIARYSSLVLADGSHLVFSWDKHGREFELSQCSPTYNHYSMKAISLGY